MEIGSELKIENQIEIDSGIETERTIKLQGEGCDDKRKIFPYCYNENWSNKNNYILPDRRIQFLQCILVHRVLPLSKTNR